ncbi:MAG: hypothetical protein V4506_04145 [Bacteroidota bacterium]
MRFTLLIVFFAVFTITSCKKERTCECSNSYSTYDAGTIEKTRGQAKRYCEKLSAGETKCKLK